MVFSWTKAELSPVITYENSDANIIKVLTDIRIWQKLPTVCYPGTRWTPFSDSWKGMPDHLHLGKIECKGSGWWIAITNILIKGQQNCGDVAIDRVSRKPAWCGLLITTGRSSQRTDRSLSFDRRQTMLRIHFYLIDKLFILVHLVFPTRINGEWM